jgi:hypothetical protein
MPSAKFRCKQASLLPAASWLPSPDRSKVPAISCGYDVLLWQMMSIPRDGMSVSLTSALQVLPNVVRSCMLRALTNGAA